MFKLLVLDFDGVISDSAPEAFAVALRTYTEMLPDSRLREHRSGLLGETAPPPERIRGEALYGGFLELMPLGNRAEDYAVMLAALEASHPLPDQAAYDVFRDRQDAAFLRAYHKRFYRVRAALSEVDPVGWQRLMAPYSDFLEILRVRAGQVTLAIATAKDRRSVRALLSLYGVGDLFSEELVLDKETGVSKVAHLEHLNEKLGVGFPEMTFIDDKVNHLDAVAPLGVRCALARWGYNGPRELELARLRGYRAFALEDVEALLFADGAPEGPPGLGGSSEAA